MPIKWFIISEMILIQKMEKNLSTSPVLVALENYVRYFLNRVQFPHPKEHLNIISFTYKEG